MVQWEGVIWTIRKGEKDDSLGVFSLRFEEGRRCVVLKGERPLGPCPLCSGDWMPSAMGSEVWVCPTSAAERRKGAIFALQCASREAAEKLTRDIHALPELPESETGKNESMQSYFQYYGRMANQMNMLQDNIRTTIYNRAIVENSSDFRGKVAIDVGAGSGILSFFAARAGAVKVYAIEASQMTEVIEQLAASNDLSDVVVPVHRRVEQLRSDEIPQVDVLVSEPIGTFLFNERMIETYLAARDRFLKPGGKMFPNRARLTLAPFSDPALYCDMVMRSQFWQNRDFHGVDLSPLAERAQDEQFRQPVVDYIDPNVLVSVGKHKDFDFTTIPIEALYDISMDFDFGFTSACLVHGVAGWFDIFFDGSDVKLWFSTSPWCPPTHWYQIRFLLQQPLAVNPGQRMTGRVSMVANDQQSYNIKVIAKIEGTDITSESTVIDLKDPDYRYYSNPAGTYMPPTQGAPAHTIPSEG